MASAAAVCAAAINRIGTNFGPAVASACFAPQGSRQGSVFLRFGKHFFIFIHTAAERQKNNRFKDVAEMIHQDILYLIDI
ncbi:MAG: hypothetical protein AAF499_17630 [Pseudomonadota bacterium]